MRAPLSGWRAAYSARIAISAGISDSAIAISLRPQPASDRSATRKSWNFESGTAAFIESSCEILRGSKSEAPASFPMRAPLNLAEPDPEFYPGTQRSSAGRIMSGILERDQPHPRSHRGVIVAVAALRLRVQGAAHGEPHDELDRLGAGFFHDPLVGNLGKSGGICLKLVQEPLVELLVHVAEALALQLVRHAA